MPIYEYRCEACGHEQEFLQKMSDEPKTVCPKCNAPKLVKKVTAAGFQLKGSGWYVTDFRNNGSNQGAKKPDSADSGGNDKPALVESKNDGASNDSSPSSATPAATAAPVSPAPAPAPPTSSAAAPAK